MGPAWYLAPYILLLGFADWLFSRATLSHEEVLEEVRQKIKNNGYRTLRRIGVGAALFALFVLSAVDVLAPALERIAHVVPRQAVVPTAAVLASLSVLAIASLILRAGYRSLARAYARGLRVWERQQAALYRK